MNHESQIFNDGICSIYAVLDESSGGGMPKPQLVYKGKLRYEERTVGMNRYTNFLQNDVKISRVLRVPRQIEVSSQDVAIPIDGEKYRVVQVQYIQDVTPKSMDLSLERIEVDYGQD